MPLPYSPCERLPGIPEPYLGECSGRERLSKCRAARQGGWGERAGIAPTTAPKIKRLIDKRCEEECSAGQLEHQSSFSSAHVQSWFRMTAASKPAQKLLRNRLLIKKK